MKNNSICPFRPVRALKTKTLFYARQNSSRKRDEEFFSPRYHSVWRFFSPTRVPKRTFSITGEPDRIYLANIPSPFCRQLGDEYISVLACRLTPTADSLKAQITNFLPVVAFDYSIFDCLYCITIL